MPFLFLKAYWNLTLFGRYLAREDFFSLYEKVRNCPVRATSPAPGTVERIGSAVNLACIWRWKEVLCLQRSAATVCLLRRNGVRAELVIGAQRLPFKAHAWVEVAGYVANDKTYTPEMYVVLDRC